VSGLRARLVVAIAAIVMATLAVAFWVVYDQTGTELRNQLDRSIHTSANQLADVIRAHPRDTPTAALGRARAFARTQPYSNASVLVFAIAPGHKTASNYPELFGDSIPDGDETGAEQREENAQGRQLEVPILGFADQPAPDTGLLRTYETAVKLRTGSTIYVGAGEPVDSIARAQHGVRNSYLVAGLLGLLVALIGAFVAGSRMAAPLRRAARTAAEVDEGDLSPRMTAPASASRELQVLSSAFNHMLDRLTDAFETQRDFVADASHELRTPLTVMRGQLDLLERAESLQGDDGARIRRVVSDEITRMTRLTDDLLLLAQADEADFLHPESVHVPAFVADLWDGLSLTADRRFETGELPQVTIRADPDRLAQALRNLGRNAVQHTREHTGLVRIDVTLEAAGRIAFAVSDDGPGIPAEHRNRIFERFYRTDPSRARAAGGAGLGLAIVRAIADAHDGTVAVSERPGGGAQVALLLPYDPESKNSLVER
jgi:two-component system, OmpR family, sensor kinase